MKKRSPRRPRSEPPPATSEGSPGAKARRQAFLRGYPDDPELDRLVDAFERGDYRAVRQGAEALAKNTDDEDVRKAAVDLRRRLDPHPLGTAILAGTAVLLLFLVVWFYSHPVHR